VGRNLPKIDGWQDLLKVIERINLECEQYTGVFDTRYYKSTLEQLVQIQQKHRFREEYELSKRIVDWVSPTSIVSDHHNRIRSELTGFYKDAGAWLKDVPEYQQWRMLGSEDGHSRFLFIRGPGKFRAPTKLILITNSVGWNWKSSLT